MSRVASSSEIDALEASVRGARVALACNYTSSDEYEAAIIKERRDAGFYDTGFHPIAWCGALIVLLTLFFVLI